MPVVIRVSDSSGSSWLVPGRYTTKPTSAVASTASNSPSVILEVRTNDVVVLPSASSRVPIPAREASVFCGPGLSITGDLVLRLLDAVRQTSKLSELRRVVCAVSSDLGEIVRHPRRVDRPKLFEHQAEFGHDLADLSVDGLLSIGEFVFVFELAAKICAHGFERFDACDRALVHFGAGIVELTCCLSKFSLPDA